jgi:hypothetical protein
MYCKCRAVRLSPLQPQLTSGRLFPSGPRCGSVRV